MSAPDTAYLRVRIVPRAGRTALAARTQQLRPDEPLVIRLAAAPVDGAANAALIAFLAELLDVPQRSISIAAGERSRLKRVRITGVTAADLAARVARAVQS